MDYAILKEAAKAISMQEDTKRRIVRSCKEQLSNAGKKKPLFKKSVFVFATLAVCLSLSVTALAASGVMKGFFRDIYNWQGAIVGTSYENATDEIEMTVTVKSNELTVQASFSDAQAAPYIYTERLGIASYQIIDASGKPVKQGSAESVEVASGQALINIPLDDMVSGNYKLLVTAFVSEKKADQPLKINGSWESTFQLN